MPKVTEEYIRTKKKVIVDAAYALCMEKTVSTVTMQDIIDKTGFSQGGIYRFYHDIDEILKDMLLDMRSRIHIKEKVDEIFRHEEEMEPAQITYEIFEMLAEFMEEELFGMEKVDFELNILAMNAPKRVEKILADMPEVGHKEYISIKTMEYFQKKIEQGRLQPRVKGEELLSYIASAYSGIQMCCIVNNCYKKGPWREQYKPKVQFGILAKTVNYLLGMEDVNGR